MGRWQRHGNCGLTAVVALCLARSSLAAEEPSPFASRPPPPATIRYWELWLPTEYPQKRFCYPENCVHSPNAMAMLQQLVKSTDTGDPNRSQYLVALALFYKDQLDAFQREVDQVVQVPSEVTPSYRPRLARTRRADEKSILSLYSPTVQYLTEASRDLRYPRREDAFIALVQTHLTMGNYLQAKVAVQALGNVFPRSRYLPYLELRLADLEARDGKYDAARTRYLAIRRSDDPFASALALYQFAWLEISEGERQAAVRLLLEAEAMCKKSAPVLPAHSISEAIWQDLLSENLLDAFVAAHSVGQSVP